MESGCSCEVSKANGHLRSKSLLYGKRLGSKFPVELSYGEIRQDLDAKPRIALAARFYPFTHCEHASRRRRTEGVLGGLVEAILVLLSEWRCLVSLVGGK